MRTAKTIAAEIADIERKMYPLQRQIEKLSGELREVESREFIRVNNIKAEDVQRNDAKEVPWYNTAFQFGAWLATHSQKPWATWNGLIYRASDLKEGRMPESKAYAEHL